MSEAKHTPGPWHFEDLGDDQGKWISANPGGGGLHKDGSYLSVCASSIGDANARLIAAAPELLEAAMDALAFMDAELNGWQEVEPERRRLRAAIAKARGEA